LSPSVLLADDHPLVLKGLVDLLELYHYTVVATCADGPSALAKIRELQPTLAILDLMLPGSSGIDVARAVIKEGLRTRIVLLTAASNEALLVKAMHSGVASVLTKDLAVEDLMAALQVASAGGQWFPDRLKEAAQRVDGSAIRTLSARESEIASLAASGLQNKQIAHKLALTEGTVKIHLYKIYGKLSVRSRTELAFLWDRDLSADPQRPNVRIRPTLPAA
jgi:two-component system, NarL family, nitrate/nitrite response regulator NarL